MLRTTLRTLPTRRILLASTRNTCRPLVCYSVKRLQSSLATHEEFQDEDYEAIQPLTNHTKPTSKAPLYGKFFFIYHFFVYGNNSTYVM